MNKTSGIPWNSLRWSVELQKTCGNNSAEVQERSVSPEGYGCKGYCTTPPLPTVLKCGAQCHCLRTRPHNSGTDKSAKAGVIAERGNASHTGKLPKQYETRMSASVTRSTLIKGSKERYLFGQNIPCEISG